MPLLRKSFNANLETTLAQTSELLTADVDLLDQLTQSLYDSVVQAPTNSEPWRIHRVPLQDAHLALQRRVMRRVLQRAIAAQVCF